MKAFIRRTLAALGYQIQGTRYTPRQLLDSRNLRSIELGDVICRRMVEVGERLAFIQIGAFDGVMADPLRDFIVRHGWRGVMVEPVGSSRVDLQACKLEYSIVSPK